MSMKNLAPVLPLLLALLAGAAPVRAQSGDACAIPAADGAWARVETDHFTLYGDAGAPVLQRLAADLEMLRSVLTEWAPSVARLPAVPVTFVAIQGTERFAAYRPRDGRGGLFGDAPGYLVAGPRGVYAALQVTGDLREARRLVYRQYILHLLAADRVPVPLWLRYGLAGVYGSMERVDGAIELGDLMGSAYVGLRAVEEHWIPLERLTALEEISGDQRELFALEAGLLLQYLIADWGHRPELTSFLRRLEPGVSAAPALREELGVDPEALSATLRGEVEDRVGRRFRRAASGATGEEATRQRTVPRGEALAVLGELLLATAEPGRALEHFRCATTAEPGHARAWRGLGRAAQLSGDADTAVAAYRKAVELDPGDARAWYLLGDLELSSLAGRPRDEAERERLAGARRALAKSVELDPGDGEAWARLGYASILGQETREAAAEELTRAVELLPGRTDVVANLLLAQGQLGRRDQVLALYGRLVEMGAEPATLVRSREVRYQLDFLEADRRVKDDRPEDAVAVYAEILARSANPRLVEDARQRLELLAAVEQHNRFAALYQQVAKLVDSGEPDARVEAAPLLEELLALARPGLQTEAAAALAASAERIPGTSPAATP